MGKSKNPEITAKKISLAQSGEKNHSWRGGRINHSKGSILGGGFTTDKEITPVVEGIPKELQPLAEEAWNKSKLSPKEEAKGFKKSQSSKESILQEPSNV